jgi:transposase
LLSEWIQSDSFEFALDHLVDHELDLSGLNARFNNDQTGASVYDPRVMLKIVLLAYRCGIVSNRGIEHACLHKIQLIAMSGDAKPSYTHITKFVCELGEQRLDLFTNVLLTCDRPGLIGRQMFAIDGVKLLANASKEHSGTQAELLHRAQRLDKAADQIIALHQSRDASGKEPTIDAQRQARIEALREEAQARPEPASKAEFHKLMLELREPGERRNDMIHSRYSPWIDVGGNEELLRQNSKLRGKAGEREESEEELQPAAFDTDPERLAQAAEKLDRFRLKVIDWLYPGVEIWHVNRRGSTTAEGGSAARVGGPVIFTLASFNPRSAPSAPTPFSTRPALLPAAARRIADRPQPRRPGRPVAPRCRRPIRAADLAGPGHAARGRG